MYGLERNKSTIIQMNSSFANMKEMPTESKTELEN